MKATENTNSAKSSSKTDDKKGASKSKAAKSPIKNTKSGTTKK